MGKLRERIRRELSPLSISIWPSINNSAWQFTEIAEAVLGPILQVLVSPLQIRRKLAAEAVASIKGRFLVTELGNLPSEAIKNLYTYADMADIARFGDDFQKIRLYQWLKASAAAGRPVKGRGRVFDSDAEIDAYCRTYLDLFRSMERHGYRYSGDDDICIGIAADGEIVHVRRGTHRVAAAQILELPSVSAKITHIDHSWAKRFDEGGKSRARDVLVTAIKAATS